MRKHLLACFLALVCLCLAFPASSIAKIRSSVMPFQTIETDHFRLNYQEGLEGIAREIGELLEEFYGIYRKTYNLTMPEKTDVLVTNNDVNEADFAYPNFNMISICANEFPFNLRGSGNFIRDVVAHEFAHVVSIWSGLKLPPWIPYVQAGYFSHPNKPGLRTEALHIVPGEILPPWFTEGITQFESTRQKGDAWDTHRDMIMRTLAVSNRLISWDHMNVFSGKGDDFEKTYNHGFSMVRYIDQTYGYGAVVSILREGSKAYRLDFDRAVKAVLGIPARQLYAEWKKWLEATYKNQIDSLGKQVYGRKINKDGFDNYWPRFSPDERKIYFISNGKNDYSFFTLGLYSYAVADTTKEDQRIKKEPLPINDYYSIHDSSGMVAFASMKSTKSNLPYRQRASDIFIDSLPPDKQKFRPFAKKTERQLTIKRSMFFPSFSPDGKRIAAAHHRKDRFYLCIADTNAWDRAILYPDTSDSQAVIRTIYSVEWSPDGKHVAFSYVEPHGDRKIGLYTVATNACSLVCETGHDERDPRFSADGKRLYFSSDRTGIFNIYRYDFASGALQRVTNVSGGAFAPDVSRDERKLVYVNYDKDGYGIYLIDTMTVLAEQHPDSAITPRSVVSQTPRTLVFTRPHPYSRLPRKLSLVPTFLSEQTVTEDSNAFKGVSVFKAGAVLSLSDPMSLLNYDGLTSSGNELGAYLLLEPSKLAKTFTFNRGFIAPGVNYDLGVFFSSGVRPVGVSTDYMQRGIAGSDSIYDEATGENLTLVYSLVPRDVRLVLSYPLEHRTGIDLRPHLVGSYNLYKVLLEIPGFAPFDYDPAKGFRLGAYVTMLNRARDSRSFVSPRGLYLKVAYDYYNQRLQNEVERFRSSNGGALLVNYDDYEYNQVSGNIKLGRHAPWAKTHDLYLDLRGTALTLTPRCVEHLRNNKNVSSDRLPPFYKPVVWLPGYTYYYKDKYKKADGTDSLTYDTVLVTGDAVAQLLLSYRFPLWPKSIDVKWGFLYFDRLYGAVNFNMGRGWDRPKDVIDGSFRMNDFLKSVGAEIRLDATTFGNFPLAAFLKWDWGFDRKPNIGGHRFTLGIGFDFDNWTMIEQPDYAVRLPKQQRTVYPR